MEEKEEAPVGVTAAVPPTDCVCCFWLLSAAVLSLAGLRTLLATVASWDTTFSTALPGAGTGGLKLKLEAEPDVSEGDALRLAAAAAQSLRLSASFLSLGMPGEEQEARGVSGPSGVWQSVGPAATLEQFGLVLHSADGPLVLGLPRLGCSALGSDGAVCPPRLFVSRGGAGWRKVSLLTEMNALPGVEKGREP